MYIFTFQELSEGHFLSYSFSEARTNASNDIRSDKADSQVLLKSV